ncbi:GntR family transcriptional regulator [Streptomyces sp. NPDC015032]|uniref:GntR family transcriptional regulator n=1 Tax=Streptomyces sp. NPDC015032 TaxID=3364937 RepID=UPI0037011932
MTSSTPPRAGQAPASQSAGRTSSADARVTAIRDRITAGHYIPGTRLTLNQLHGVTGYSPAELRSALEQLARAGLVHGRWRVTDHRPGDHAVRRTHDLLTAMIDHGTFPPGTEMPTRTDLSAILLTTPLILSRALQLLAAEGVLHLSGRSRPRVLPPRSGPSPAGWPAGNDDDVLAALPQRRSAGISHCRDVIQGIRDSARERWHSGICLPAEVMTMQETLQGDILSRLILAAYAQVNGRPRGEYPRLRSAAARAMACATLPVDGLLYERLFRFAVLATSLADLADALDSRNVCRAAVHQDSGLTGTVEAPAAGPSLTVSAGHTRTVGM